MEHERDLELLVEKFITQRLYPSKVPLSDGFQASLQKEINDLKNAGYKFPSILKQITYRSKEINSDKSNNEKLDKMRDNDGPRLPEKVMSQAVKTMG